MSNESPRNNSGVIETHLRNAIALRKWLRLRVRDGNTCEVRPFMIRLVPFDKSSIQPWLFGVERGRENAAGRFFICPLAWISEISDMKQPATDESDSGVSIYPCGLSAGDRITLTEDIIIHTLQNGEIGQNVLKKGTVWEVRRGIEGDESSVWLRQARTSDTIPLVDEMLQGRYMRLDRNE